MALTMSNRTLQICVSVALLFHHKVVTIEESCQTDPSPGASDDWFIGALGVRFAGTLELRHTAFGAHMEDPDNIIPTGNETWAGLKVMLEKIIELSEEDQTFDRRPDLGL